MADNDTVPAHQGLTCIAGAAAAVMRGDHEGAGLLIGDLIASHDLVELLVTISIVTLHQLDTALQHDASSPRADAAPLAGELLGIAEDYTLGDPSAVRSAAWRLESVRFGDQLTATAAVETSLDRLSAIELVVGATALFAATVALTSTVRRVPAQRTIEDLCLAASSVIVD